MLLEAMHAERIRNLVSKAVQDSFWDFANNILYQMCRDFPLHNRPDVIAAKILLIGRTYAAAIERRKVKGRFVGDNFYKKNVAPRILGSQIDQWLVELRAHPPQDTERNLEIHLKVATLFKRIAGIQKRSLASKYLHFHLPQHFYLFDSRSSRAIAKLCPPANISQLRPRTVDRSYAAFTYRCESAVQQIQTKTGLHLSPRDLDKFLLAYYQIQRKFGSAQ